MKIKKKFKEEVWQAMYEMALKEPRFLKGMIIVVTDAWDEEDWKNCHASMCEGECK